MECFILIFFPAFSAKIMGEKISGVGWGMKLGFSSLGCAIAIRGVFEFVYSNICDDTVISIS